MKLKNFFKKESVQNTTNKQVLSKDQLEKVIGGAETTTAVATTIEEPSEAGRVGRPKYNNITL